jgi:hypothetical protein
MRPLHEPQRHHLQLLGLDLPPLYVQRPLYAHELVVHALGKPFAALLGWHPQVLTRHVENFNRLRQLVYKALWGRPGEAKVPAERAGGGVASSATIEQGQR